MSIEAEDGTQPERKIAAIEREASGISPQDASHYSDANTGSEEAPALAQSQSTSIPSSDPAASLTVPTAPGLATAGLGSATIAPILDAAPSSTIDTPRRKPLWLDWRVLTVLLLAAASIPIWRATTSHAKVPRPAPSPALPVVAVARVERQDLYNNETYLAEFKPYFEVELHAKVSGYVQEINVDFGDKVKAGQLLAKLEVPELQDELEEAIATQKRAEADYSVAHKAYTRLLAVDQQNPNLVVQQELDAAEGKDHTTEAAIAAAKADVEKYQTLVHYTRIYAPFDGIVTARYVDPGALVQSGTASSTQSLPIVRISDNYHLRLDFPVSLPYVKDIQPGEPVEVRVDSLGKTFTGKITRCTQKVDEATRKMVTEVEVPNPNLELVPGMYATAVQKVDKRASVLSIPIEAVSSEKEPTVYVVNAQQRIEERPITLGLITPDHYEVKAGLKEGDLVLIGSRSGIKPGEKVIAKPLGALAQQ